MGFRSTLTTFSYYGEWPQWFREKYTDGFLVQDHGPLLSLFEHKKYGWYKNLHEDIQRAIDWEYRAYQFVLVYLHECGGITRCQIEKDAIKWSEPLTWRLTDGITHEYCYGCSDAAKALPNDQNPTGA